MMVWFLVGLERGLRGALEAALLANAAVTLVMLPDLVRFAKLRLRKDVLRGILSYGMPLLPHQLAIFLLFGADRYFIGAYGTVTDVGIYSYGYRVGMMMTIVLEGASLAWTPFIFSIQRREDAKRIHALTGRYVATIIIGVAVGLIVFGPELTMLLAFAAPEYWTAAVLVPWIVGGYVFLGAYQVFAAAVGIPKRTRLLGIFSLTGLAVNIGLNFLLVPTHGTMGAAIATTISYACMAVVATAITQKVHHIPYEWNRFVILCIAGLVAVLVGWLLPGWSLWPTVGIKFGVVLLFPALLAVLGFFSAGERQRMRELGEQVIAAATRSS
jgi:O-antigen/teichoic acid export membrane protein